MCFIFPGTVDWGPPSFNKYSAVFKKHRELRRGKPATGTGHWNAEQGQLTGTVNRDCQLVLLALTGNRLLGEHYIRRR